MARGRTAQLQLAATFAPPVQLLLFHELHDAKCDYFPHRKNRKKQNLFRVVLFLEKTGLLNGAQIPIFGPLFNRFRRWESFGAETVKSNRTRVVLFFHWCLQLHRPSNQFFWSLCWWTERLSNDYVRNFYRFSHEFCMLLRNVVGSIPILCETNRK